MIFRLLKKNLSADIRRKPDFSLNLHFINFYTHFMIIENEKVVSVAYELSVFDNEVETIVEKTESKKPFVFLVGTGHLLEAFENNLKGLKVGDKFDFIIDYKNGYGEKDAQNIASIPLEAFKNKEGELDDEMVKLGNILPMVDNDGNRLNGIVQEIGPEFITMDFNHPLAEKDLHFIGEVLNVRTASQEEMSHGHVHGEGGVHH
jgi:FKBP-type peptidyl-prolyl cis-trans isomerase SlyD